MANGIRQPFIASTQPPGNPSSSKVLAMQDLPLSSGHTTTWSSISRKASSTLYVQRSDEPSVSSQHKFPIRDDLGDTYLRCQSYGRFHTRCKDSPSGQIYTGPQLADTGEGLVSVVLAK